jgi:hypothetical protein
VVVDEFILFTVVPTLIVKEEPFNFSYFIGVTLSPSASILPFTSFTSKCFFIDFLFEH